MGKKALGAFIAFLLVASFFFGAISGPYFTKGDDSTDALNRAQSVSSYWVVRGLEYAELGITNAINDSSSNPERLLWTNVACPGLSITRSAADGLRSMFGVSSDEYLAFDNLSGAAERTLAMFTEWFKNPLGWNSTLGTPYAPNSTVNEIFGDILTELEELRYQMRFGELNPDGRSSVVKQMDLEVIKEICAGILTTMQNLDYPVY